MSSTETVRASPERGAGRDCQSRPAVRGDLHRPHRNVLSAAGRSRGDCTTDRHPALPAQASTEVPRAAVGCRIGAAANLLQRSARSASPARDSPQRCAGPHRQPPGRAVRARSGDDLSLHGARPTGRACSVTPPAPCSSNGLPGTNLERVADHRRRRSAPGSSGSAAAASNGTPGGRTANVLMAAMCCSAQVPWSRNGAECTGGHPVTQVVIPAHLVADCGRRARPPLRLVPMAAGSRGPSFRYGRISSSQLPTPHTRRSIMTSSGRSLRGLGNSRISTTSPNRRTPAALTVRPR